MKKRLVACAIACLIIATATSCATFEAKAQDYDHLVGYKWSLESVTVDTHPIEFEKKVIQFNENNTGTVIITTVLAKAVLDDDGEVITPATTQDTAYKFVVSNINNTNGTMTLTLDNSEVQNLDFNVDVSGGILHLISTDSEGRVRHEYYIDSAFLTTNTAQ